MDASTIFRTYVDFYAPYPLRGFRKLIDHLIARTGVDTSWAILCPEKPYAFLEEHLDELFSAPEFTDPDRLVDPLGELAVELRAVAYQPSFEKLVRRLADIPVPDQEVPVRIHDPRAGVGRGIIAAFRRFGHRAVYTGVVYNPIEYRIALINMRLFRIDGVLLFPAFFTRLSVDNPEDWGWANQLLIPAAKGSFQRYESGANRTFKRHTPKGNQAPRNPYKRIIRLKH